MPHSNQGYTGSHIHGPIATIEFFHPQSNSLPGDLLAALEQAILECGRQDSVQVIILRSAGEKAFCAGASFEELSAIGNLESGRRFFSGFASVINAIRTCGKIVISRIQGKAVGGGVGIAAASDLSFATSAASFRLSELAVGIGPFVIGPAVERKVGLSAFSHWSLTPDTWQTAEEGTARGLYHRVFDDIASMDEHIEQFAQQLAAYNPEALAALKKVFWQGTDHWSGLLVDRAGISGALVLSEFTREAIGRFARK